MKHLIKENYNKILEKIIINYKEDFLIFLNKISFLPHFLLFHVRYNDYVKSEVIKKLLLL